MRRLAREYATDPTIIALSRKLTLGLPPKAWRSEVERLFHFVRDQVRYCLDPVDCEGLQTPVETLRLGQGDCDDKCMLLAALLRSIGHPSEFVAVQVDGQAHYSHVFLRTRIGDRWVSLETTEPWPMGKVGERITGKPLALRV